MDEIQIAGGGPAGGAAALAARLEGAPVRLVERSAHPRHKVCGEFISPGAAGILQQLGVWDEFQALGPRRIRRCVLHLGRHRKQWTLAEPGWGLSRRTLDNLLLERAAAAGAEVSRGAVFEPEPNGPVIVAHGRSTNDSGSDRLFGFKAHFSGPCDDAVELFFDREGYAGVSGVEDGFTNVCGIATESVLRRYGFDFDGFIRRTPALRERLHHLERAIEWVAVGPVVYRPPARSVVKPDSYLAGDALGFVDPFTGTGILNALLTGRMAGIAAARQVDPAIHLRECRSRLARPYFVASILRRGVTLAGTSWIAPWIPGRLLFSATRAI